MPSHIYRTNKTSLSDEQLLILDVIFAGGGVKPRMLRQRHFAERWNATSHALSDEQLKATIKEWLHAGVLKAGSTESYGRYIAMTPTGGELWASERCPIWDRYCTEFYPVTTPGRQTMTVECVSASVRDDFLRLCPEYPARKKTATVTDNGLIKWRDFGTLHIGHASYVEPTEWTSDEYEEWLPKHLAHVERVETERTWWRSVGELQKFVRH